MPRQRITEYTVYKFEELSDGAKEKARDEWIKAECQCGDPYWSECVIDNAVEQAKFMGIEIGERKWTNSYASSGGTPMVYFSGFSSQGDGACFEGQWYASDVEVGKTAGGWGVSSATTEIKRIASVFEEIAEKYPEASFSVVRRGHYSHEMCTVFECSLGDDYEYDHEADEAEFDAVKDDLIENARDYMRWIYRQLNDEYDYRMSDEAIHGYIEANEWEFFENGQIA